jgi:asparagine N-glycosylation enzyme membrane subunit Stt3
MNLPPTKSFFAFLRRPAVIVFLVSALAKALFGFIFVTDAERIISDPDSIGYLRLAENLWHHGVFSRSEQPPFAPDNVLTPIYPLFVAALLTLARGSLWIIPIAQGLLNSLGAVLVFKMGERWFGIRAGFIAGICFALDLSALVHSFSLLTESLFAFLFLAANFCWRNTRRSRHSNP